MAKPLIYFSVCKLLAVFRTAFRILIDFEYNTHGKSWYRNRYDSQQLPKLCSSWGLL